MALEQDKIIYSIDVNNAVRKFYIMGSMIIVFFAVFDGPTEFKGSWFWKIFPDWIEVN